MYYRQPNNGLHEHKIMDQQITTIEANELITDKERVRGSLLLLVATHRQKNCKDIVTFVWRLYVSYRCLNSITITNKFPIPRYANSIEYIGDSCSFYSMISLYTCSGCH